MHNGYLRCHRRTHAEYAPPIHIRPCSWRQRLQVVLAVLLPVVFVLLAAVLFAWYRYRQLLRASTRERGAKQAPGVGPLTTLIVTDIQNSTGMWEVLPEEVRGSCGSAAMYCSALCRAAPRASPPPPLPSEGHEAQRACMMQWTLQHEP